MRCVVASVSELKLQVGVTDMGLWPAQCTFIFFSDRDVRIPIASTKIWEAVLRELREILQGQEE